MSNEGPKLPKFESFLIVEDDVPVATSLARLVTGNGICTNPEMAHNGTDAWKKITSKVYDFVVLDWKLPGLSGLTVLNKMRASAQHRDVPVLVNSGFLRRPEATLLTEFPFVELAGKPSSSARLVAQMAQLQDFQREYLQFAVPIDEWLQGNADLRSQTLPGLLEAMSNHWDDESMQQKALMVKLADALIESGFVQEAIDFVQPALTRNESSLFYRTLMGKIHLAKGDFQNANILLSAAQQDCQENLVRTQYLAETYLQGCNFEEAQSCYKAMSRHSLDGERFAKGKFLTETLPQSMPNKPFNVPVNLAGYCSLALNGLVKNGLNVEAKDLYEAATTFIRDPFVRSNYAYNIGLGLVHASPKEAYTWFKLSYELSGNKFSEARDQVNHLAAEVGCEEIADDGEDSPQFYQFDRDNFTIVGTKKAG